MEPTAPHELVKALIYTGSLCGGFLLLGAMKHFVLPFALSWASKRYEAIPSPNQPNTVVAPVVAAGTEGGLMSAAEIWGMQNAIKNMDGRVGALNQNINEWRGEQREILDAVRGRVHNHSERIVKLETTVTGQGSWLEKVDARVSKNAEKIASLDGASRRKE